MSNLAPVFMSIIAVLVLVFLLSKRFNISSRYERKPKTHTPWSALDNGIDPTENLDEK
jgi:hypothetical protein